MKRLFTGFTAFLIIFGLQAQRHNETISRELSFTRKSNQNTLIIDNINGHVEVEAYQGETIQLKAEKTLLSRFQKDLEQAKKDIQLKTEIFGDTILVFIDGVCDCNCNRRRGGRYHWNNCDNDVDFVFDFKIKVPGSIHLDLSTVNKGDIVVKNSSGKIRANNVNGAITLNNIEGATKVHTINGDVDITYSKNPQEGSSYYTLNGDLTIFYLPGLNADMRFKSFNGDFYTEFEYQQGLPSRVVSSKRNRGTSYKIEDITGIKVGSGGLQLDFETFNGDIYIRKK